MIENEIALVTYTNSKCHDVLKIHLGQLRKFAPKFKSFVFSDSPPDFDVGENIIVLYDNSDPYHKQYIECLESVKEDYIVYLLKILSSMRKK